MTYREWIGVGALGYTGSLLAVAVVGFTNMVLVAIAVAVVCVLAQGSGDQ